MSYLNVAGMIVQASPKAKNRVSYINAKFSVSQSTKDALHDDDKGKFGVVFTFDEPSEREEA